MQRFARYHVGFAALIIAWAWMAHPASAQEESAGEEAQAETVPGGPDEGVPAGAPDGDAAGAEEAAALDEQESEAAKPAEPAAQPAQPAVEQSGTITGRVMSEGSGIALPGASVSLVGTDKAAITDEDGGFSLAGVAPGIYTLEVSLIGYLRVTAGVAVVQGATAEAVVRLVDDPQFSEVIVMVGSRTERTTTQTPVPVDIITSTQIQESGQVETNLILATVAPSFSASHQTIADGSDHVIPASLRGLGPDQVLVLVNGKRRHSSALVHVNGTFGRGTVGVALSAIPPGAIERIEVLRDGAAAQYGSDAIAGVINIVLKDHVDIGEVTARSGITASGDGFELKVGGNYGVRLGQDAIFNVTGEFLQRNPTDRSREWTGSFYGSDLSYEETTSRLADQGLTRKDVSMRIGQSQATVGAAMFNLKLPMDALEVYSFGGVTYREGESAGFYRRPEQVDRVDLDHYPNGFLPEIHASTFDWSLGAGARLDLGGLDIDLSGTHGGNAFNFGVENSNNASLGVAAGGTSFDAGGTLFHQTSFNADLVKKLEVQGIDKLGLVGGTELRVENFRIMAGEESSYAFGNETYVDADGNERPKAPGAQVFPGYPLEAELSEHRTALAAYVGAESEITKRVLIDVGGRFENYSDFGRTAIGKVAGRFNMLDNVAVRGAVSTGFRAPSLHQVWFNTISTLFVENPDTGGLEPKQVLTANNRSDVAKAFGIPELKEETSFNLSAGFTARLLEGLSLTADVYRIAIDDRVVLSGRFTDALPGVAEILGEFPDVSQAQFFVNAVDTRTLGTDLVLDYAIRLGPGRLGLTGTANFTRTKVVNRNVPQSVADALGGGDLEAVREVIFNDEEENRLEDALPRQKGMFSARYGLGPASLLGRARYYGPVRDHVADEDFSGKTIFDVDLGYKLSKGLKLSVGGTNIFNTFPDEQQKAENRYYEQFIYSRRVSQFGINGAFYYVQLQYFL